MSGNVAKKQQTLFRNIDKFFRTRMKLRQMGFLRTENLIIMPPNERVYAKKTSGFEYLPQKWRNVGR